MKKELLMRILFELMKKSRISDRKLARDLGLWQSTITRYRKRLEEKTIQECTFVPDLKEIGYEILSSVLLNGIENRLFS